MSHAAALLAGLGGLLVEIVLVRRYGLLLGNTAEASAAVLALFLAGLGAGGLAAGRLRLDRRGPRRWAALLYGMVAMASPLADAVLAGLGPVSWGVGLALAAVAPGLLAFGMGVAFPMLCGAVRAGPWSSGGLVAANLLGSVAAAFLGGNLLVPMLGLGATLWIGAAAYGLAAVVLWAAGHTPLDPAVARRPLRWALLRRTGAAGTAARAAFASGLLVLGFEVVLLRRLPFWLDGFQPTLSGVLAACLLALTLGAGLGTGLLQRAAGRRAPAVAIGLAGVLVASGLHEVLGPRLAMQPLASSDAGMHARVLLTALVTALPLLLLGAVVPLFLARLRHDHSRAALAGRLFFWQGAGALVGALLANQALPLVFPASWFVAAPCALAMIAGLLLWRRPAAPPLLVVFAVGSGVLGLSPAGSVLSPEPPFCGAHYDYNAAWGRRPARPGSYRYLAHRTDSYVTASVVYDRRNHSTMLFTDGFRATETGPGTAYMKALGHLPFLLRPGLRDVAVIALGTGTTANAVTVWPDPVTIDVVEISPAVLELVPYFAGDGPLHAGEMSPRFLADARTRVRITDGRRYLAERAPASLDLVTLEPLLPYAPGTAPLYSAEFYALARRALRPGGIIVQWIPTHAMPVATFDTLLATFARGFPRCSVWLVDQATLLVGSTEPHLPDAAALRARLEQAGEPVRAALHETGLATLQDLQAAFVGDALEGVFAAAPTLHDDRPFLERIGHWTSAEKLLFLPDNIARLAAVGAASSTGPWASEPARAVRALRLDGLALRARARLEPGQRAVGRAVQAAAAARSKLGDAVLLHREETLALRQLVEGEVLARGGRFVADRARRHLQRDLRSPLLHVASVLADPGEEIAASRRAAALAAALALDPLLFVYGPAFLRPLAPPAAGPGVLEDVQVLPAGEELVRAALGGARGVALRGTFGVRVGRAFIDLLGRRPLTAPEVAALRPVLDPLLLELAAGAVLARGGDPAAELYPLWRRDLPMPRALLLAADAGVPERLRLAAALAGHRGPRARAALARLMLDPEHEVRVAAAVTLFETWGDQVAYDPAWDAARRQRAAARLK